MADEMNVTAVTLKRWENEDGIPGKAAQEKLISICQKEKIDLAEVVEESIREQAQEIAKSNPYREILFHGSESGLKGNISLANRICRDYRREGKYFDEITVRDLSSGSGKNHECKLPDVSHDGSGDGSGGS